MRPIAIAGVGLCTAQGGARELLARNPLRPPRPLPWTPSSRASCTVGFATSIDPALRGAARWRALADAALDDLGGSRDVPLFVGSCNGAADSHDAHDWRSAFVDLGVTGPIASAACASGLHALWLGATWIAAGHDAVIVLAVDTLSRASHDNFEGLRVLANDPAAWQPTATGFIPGEAAVALRLVGHDSSRPGNGEELRIGLAGPLLAHDVDEGDALTELIRHCASPVTSLVIGQGTGPAAIDARELAAIRETIPREVPLASALASFGHTIGASGLLSVALAALARHRAVAIDALAMPHKSASDGRTLLGRESRVDGNVLVVCRALGGACAAIGVGDDRGGLVRTTEWSAPGSVPALRMPLLRQLAGEARTHRPITPPGALIVRLDAPLVPPDDALIGGRLLPSVVLEMTPGFLAQLVARIWGYRGPALCLVGGTEAATLAAVRAVHGEIAVLHVRERSFEWQL